MVSLQRVAVAGASGNLGPVIIKEHIGRHVQRPWDVDVVEVDYQDLEGLTKALEGVDVVVSTIGNAGLGTQIRLVDASVAAGVKRFLPSEFGADPEQEKNKRLPFYLTKAGILDHLKKKAAENPGFSYTTVTPHIFFDWGLETGFLADPKEHKMTVYDGGDVPFSVTNLSTIAKAVVGVIKHLGETKNRPVFIHDAAITQNQLIHLAKQVDGVEWTITEKDTRQVLQDSPDKLKKPNADISKASHGQIMTAVYNKDHKPDLTSKLDNKLLGIPVLGEKEVAEVIKEVMNDALSNAAWVIRT